MRSFSRSQIIYISLGFLSVVVIAFLFLIDEKNVKTVMLTDTGFSPDKLTIRQGDTVTFSSMIGNFWPASDSHPNHLAYPEFDPRRPVGATSTWSFRFDKPGIWSFHDHIASRYKGEVVVLDVAGNLPDDRCDEDNKTAYCFERIIKTTLSKGGIDQALEKIAELYQSEPQFRAQCHSYAHILGESAYEAYEKGELDTLSGKVTYCGYGFFHGFMEKMLQITGDIKGAQGFCHKMGELLMKETSDAEGACYHGIGHGMVDGGDPTAWGDPIKMTAPAIKLCEAIAPVMEYEGKRFRCITGIYNSIEILSQSAQYKLKAFARDPFAYCETQPVAYQEGCYTNMLPALKRVYPTVEEQLREIMKLPEGSIEEPIRAKVLSNLITEYASDILDSTDFTQSGVNLCRSLREDVRIACINGLSLGLMKYGEPGKEYVRAFAFCSSEKLEDDERDTCYRQIIPRLRIWYSFEKIASICKAIPKQYSNLCASDR
jgi:hypothetical protein